MELDVDVDLLSDSVLSALKESAITLLSKLAAPGSDELWSFRDIVWPAWRENAEPGLVLVPLDRIGAEQGHSGTHVMIGYFVDKTKKSPVFPSKPMVVKNYRHEPGAEYHKLETEQANGLAVKEFVAYHKDAFAIPIHYNATGELSFLWSPFASSKWIFETVVNAGNAKLTLGANDFLALLRAKDDLNQLERVMTLVFRLLMPLHRRNGGAKRKKVDLVDHYKWYLRNVDKKGDWGDKWSQIWGLSHVERIQDFNKTWTNPFFVLESLKSLGKQPVYCGATHGDLHPRNIVMTEYGIPHIIDFGWSSADSHIAKDFVLLESNLRFVTLPSSISSSDLSKLARWVEFNAPPPKLKNTHAMGAIRLIEVLRDNAKTHFADKVDWDVEYIIPLFLVSFGLLLHIESYDNQMSARYTVLSLADYIYKSVLPRLKTIA
jgi:Ternary complex associated domain 9